MWTPQKKAKCLARFIETKSDTQVQRNFRTLYGREPPPRSTIRVWYRSFMETDSVLSINKGRVAHLLQMSTLHLGIIRNPPKNFILI
ncbi:hypothetical protein AVEN_100706-1 [Araneus ventricosus]|uniref:DUF4817 domain-containing protein n=1 Tax=Araneus ventricosus TaxID=182803 RepID=A0A4Y2CTQ3_ARAVE|nr:hypothetical protein AVEN_100706-1 [Araneus ventricosus]